jgi:hypothetical protein
MGCSGPKTNRPLPGREAIVQAPAHQVTSDALTVSDQSLDERRRMALCQSRWCSAGRGHSKLRARSAAPELRQWYVKQRVACLGQVGEGGIQTVRGSRSAGSPHERRGEFGSKKRVAFARRAFSCAPPSVASEARHAWKRSRRESCAYRCARGGLDQSRRQCRADVGADERRRAAGFRVQRWGGADPDRQGAARQQVERRAAARRLQRSARQAWTDDPAGRVLAPGAYGADAPSAWSSSSRRSVTGIAMAHCRPCGSSRRVALPLRS